MLNIFKKKILNAVANTVKEVFSEPVSVTETIEKIHNEFDSASERLLNEAKSILAIQKDTSKGERLRSIGFSSAKPVVEAIEAIQIKQQNIELANNIEHYKINYPFHKFITETEVERICKKYGLLFGEANYYIGDMPEKNITEIENFSLKKEDLDKHENNWYSYADSGYYAPTKPNEGRWGYVICERNRNRVFYTASENEKFSYVKRALKICASEKDFDTRYMRIEDGYKLAPIPDPIVLQPVKGGYLIVTKWGLEASDEMVVNEINN